jgi:type I restriction enzyme S subunit
VKQYYSFISKEVAATAKRLACGDILLAGSGETKEEIGKCAAFIENIEAYAGGDIVIFSPRDTDSLFLGYLLNSPLVVKQKANKGQGDAVVHISASSLKEVNVPIPQQKEEQTAIAAVLSGTDALIERLEKLIAKKKAIKQGTMQQLLTGRKRLPGFSGAWPSKHLGELFEITSSKRVFQSEWKTEGIPFYRARELAVLSERGHVNNELFISKEMYGAFKNAFGVPEIGDILVTGVGTLGKVYVVETNKQFYFKDGNIIWFKVSGKVNSEFLRQLYLTPAVIKQIDDGATGTTVGTYTITAAKKTIVPFPSLSEQAAIADVLSDMDAEIYALEQKRNKYVMLKQGMMQQLLTGKIRIYANK